MQKRFGLTRLGAGSRLSLLALLAMVPGAGSGQSNDGMMPVEVSSVQLERSSAGEALLIGVDSAIEWSAERESKGSLELMLGRSVPGPYALDIAASEGLVSSVEVELSLPLGVPTTRIVVHGREDFDYEVVRRDPGLAVELRSLRSEAVASAVEHVERSEEPAASLPAQADEESELRNELAQVRTRLAALDGELEEATASRDELREQLRKSVEDAEVYRERAVVLHEDRLRLVAELEEARDELAAATTAAARSGPVDPPSGQAGADSPETVALRDNVDRLERQLELAEERATLVSDELKTLRAAAATGKTSDESELRRQLDESRRSEVELRRWLARAPSLLGMDELVVAEGATRCLELRPEPSGESSALECLEPGVELRALSMRPDWLRVRAPNGKEGWVSHSGVVAAAGPRAARLEEEIGRRERDLGGDESAGGDGRVTELAADLEKALATVEELESSLARAAAREADLQARLAEKGGQPVADSGEASRVERLEQALAARTSALEARDSELAAARQARRDLEAKLAADIAALSKFLDADELVVAAGTDPCLTLRADPGTEAERVDCLEPGTELDLRGVDREWFDVAIADGRHGWVLSSYVSPARRENVNAMVAELDDERDRLRIELEAVRSAAEEEKENAREASAQSERLESELREARRMVHELESASAEAFDGEEHDAERERLTRLLADAEGSAKAAQEREESLRTRLEEVLQSEASLRLKVEQLTADRVGDVRVGSDVTSCLALRSEPSADAERLDCLEEGTRGAIVGEQTGWWELLLADGRRGWSARRYLERIEDVDLARLEESLEQERVARRTLQDELEAAQERVAGIRQLETREEELEGRVAELENALAGALVQVAESDELTQQLARQADALASLESQAEADRSARVAAEAALAAGEVKVARLESEREVVVASAADDDTALTAAESRIAALEAEVAESRSSVTSLKSQAEADRSARVAAEAALAAREAEVARLESEREVVASAADDETALTAAESRIAALEAEVAESGSSVTSLKSQAEADRSARVAAEAALAAREAEIARLESEREVVVASAADDETALTAAESRIAALEAEVAESRSSVTSLQSQAEADRSARVAAEAALAAREAEIARLESEREVVVASAADDETALTAAESRIAALEAEVAESRSLVTSLQSQAEADRAARIEAEAALAAFDLEVARLRSQRQEQSAATLDTPAPAMPLVGDLGEQRDEPAAEPERVEPATAVGSTPELVPAEPMAPQAPAPAEPMVVDVEQEVLDIVEAWARSWADQRVDDYLSFYGVGFVPPSGLSRESWRSQRRQRLSAPTFIEVEIASPRVEMATPESGIVTFTQGYRSNTYQDSVTKSLGMARENGVWKIVQETSE